MYEEQYWGQDTWQQYVNDVLFDGSPPVDGQMIRRYQLTKDSWVDHMETRGRHHALATPQDVMEWCRKLLAGDRTVKTCYKNYYARVYAFYDYLQSSYEYPHLYNPLLLAAVEYEPVRQIWKQRVAARHTGE